MICDSDVLRSAHLVMKHYGEDAEWHAGGRSDDLLLAGDVEGSLTWLRIVRAIREIRSPLSQRPLN